ncbi:MAG: rhombosortase [Gammaproteobacteria bacterium]
MALIAAAGGAHADEWLRYERSYILNGEIWRLFTAHFVHLGWSHLLMNLAALALIWMLFGRMLRLSAWMAVSLASMLGVSLGLLFFSPSIGWYVGLSGMLHGLFAAGVMASLRAGNRLEIILLLLLLGKLVWEQIYGPLPGTAEFAGGAVVTDAHLYGAVSGFMVVLVYMFAKGGGWRSRG